MCPTSRRRFLKVSPLTAAAAGASPWLEVDPALAQVTAVGGGRPAALADARFLLKGVARPAYALAEQPI